MEKSITIQEFIEQLVEISNQKGKTEEEVSADLDSYIKGHIVNRYTSYNDKVTVCSVIVDNTVGDENTQVNSYLRKILFELSMLDIYTDIDFGDAEQYLEAYDMLEQYDLTTLLLDYINKSEYDRFHDILDALVNDHYEDHQSISAKLGQLINLFMLIANSDEEDGEYGEERNND